MAGDRWRLGRRPALDGLRGVAILLVLAAHVGKGLGYRSGGTAGVTLFFVLSGFLITSLLLEEHAATGMVSLRAFYMRRARRLLPALAVVLLFVVAVYQVFGAPLRQLVPVVFYVANWPRASGHEIALLNHTWSLAIEEQFYILWPLVLIVGLRRWRRWLLLLTVAAATGSFALRVLLWDGSVRQDRVWFGTDTNAFALLAGCALALWMSGRVTRPNRPHLAAAIVGALVVVSAASSTIAYTYAAPLVATIVGVVAIIYLCGTGPVGIFGAAWLRYVGRRSYAYYLWHVPILLLAKTAGASPVVAGVLTICLTVAIAELSWRLVEARFLVRATHPHVRTPRIMPSRSEPAIVYGRETT